MPSFNEIINQAKEKFNLGDEAEMLFSALSALITDKANGGFAGFLQRFNDAGLGNTASSWVNSGANTPISNEQLESVLGENTLNDISRNVGLDYQTTTSVSAFMIPQIVDQLTPEGVPLAESDLLSRIGRTISDIPPGEPFDRVGTAAARIINEENRVVEANFGAVAGSENNSALRWILPLIILALLLALGFMFCSKSEPVANIVDVNANQSAINVNSNSVVNANK
jgi:uncharacterized protein YidB (DUF937 family)